MGVKTKISDTVFTQYRISYLYFLFILAAGRTASARGTRAFFCPTARRTTYAFLSTLLSLVNVEGSKAYNGCKNAYDNIVFHKYSSLLFIAALEHIFRFYSFYSLHGAHAHKCNSYSKQSYCDKSGNKARTKATRHGKRAYLVY